MPRAPRPDTLQRLLAVEALVFVLAALVHGGFLIEGHRHAAALIAETVIAFALAASFLVAAMRPSLTRAAALGGQGFALLGTLAGIVAIAAGVGPRTRPDLVFHAALVLLLAGGLVAARSLPRRPRPTIGG